MEKFNVFIKLISI